MKRNAVSALLLISSAAMSQSQMQSPSPLPPIADALGMWRTAHFQQAGISVATPCTPELSYSDQNDGYGHTGDRVTLKCNVGPLGPGGASFRIERWWYKKYPGLTVKEFKGYMELVRSMDAGTYKGPRIMIAGQQLEKHQDFQLSQKAIHGDLGYHETPDECFWNFYGLAGESIVQAVMTVPKRMCPTGQQSKLTDMAARFYNSIIVEGI